MQLTTYRDFHREEEGQSLRETLCLTFSYIVKTATAVLIKPLPGSEEKDAPGRAYQNI
ncbi:MAG: hypothetical protein RDV48_05665 [Candidatus Eremiobacteraeota bacterium]|nr:hypothetical protein [Candidatus Eremiobacteraeota bacterium]